MEKKVLLSVQDLVVKFKVRGRSLTAIRGISLDIYENESIAIVGESGSGKSVFTKTFPAMLDSNGYIDNGKILFNDPEISKATVMLGNRERKSLKTIAERLNRYSGLENGASVYHAMQDLKAERKSKLLLTEEEQEQLGAAIQDLKFERAETFNYKQTLDPSKEKDAIKEAAAKLKEFDKKIKEMEKQEVKIFRERKAALRSDSAYNADYKSRMDALKAEYAKKIAESISDETRARNDRLARDILLSASRFGGFRSFKLERGLENCLKNAMREGLDLNDDAVLDDVFAPVIFRQKLVEEKEDRLEGVGSIDLACVKFAKDLSQIRGKKIATVFQDPMTSLNPTITIGKQISSVIMKHQNCSETEARAKALEMMHKVGIPNPEDRYDDYPFQYSGGMRQRIVIAIALSCQPKILICDEPTTALDVTIQAQILKLIKDLQREYNYTIVFITHDLGVVANIADRVAVMYAGQIVELGTVEDVFYDPKHPYTWALLSSLPQLAQRNTELYSINGTPPSLYNKIVGDPFAPRNPYCMKIDTVLDAPMFKVSDTHFAKTWLLDPRSPKVEKPEIIQNMHEKLLDSFHIGKEVEIGE